VLKYDLLKPTGVPACVAQAGTVPVIQTPGVNDHYVIVDPRIVLADLALLEDRRGLNSCRSKGCHSANPGFCRLLESAAHAKRSRAARHRTG
jgi:hypothetical protein